MQINRWLIPLSILLLGSLQAFTQEKGDKKDKLAVQYYQDESYEKALPLFEELFSNNRSSSYFYEYYLKTLLKLEDYDEAIDMLDNQIATFDRLKYQVDLGYVYSLDEQEDEAKSTYQAVIDKIAANENQIKIVANSFKNRGEVGYAIKAYKNGRDKLGNELAFSLQLARIYKQKGDNEEMFQEYVNALKQDPQSKNIIQKELQELVINPGPYGTFKGVLLDEIRANPGKKILIDMLSWLFIQNENFNAAFVQLKALQKRLETNGSRLIQLAKVARKNENYRAAESVYEYIQGLGENNPFYFRAKQGGLDVQYDRITKLGDFTKGDLKQLEADYEAFINDQRFSYQENGSVFLRLAEVKATYRDNITEAINLLKDLVEKDLRGNKSLKAKARLALGDYYVLKDKVWDAQLTYSKVEKMFKDNPLGHQAKFRNAKLSFYKGNFDWAASQLQILKGATSELIANDALELEMLIKDNRGLDTTEIPLQIYAKADLYIFKNQFDKANKKLDSLMDEFPEHNLSDEVYFAKARIAEKQNHYDSATNYLEKVYTNYENDILADDALFKAAKLYENRLNDLEKAKATYEMIILDHKASVYKIKARENFRRLRGDVMN